jgi:hypothetical protein
MKDLVSALESNDKQTRIFSANALYNSAKRNLINEAILLKIIDYVADEISDVSIYSIAAYTEGLKKLLQNTS